MRFPFYVTGASAEQQHALLQEVCDGARQLVASDEWEQRLGGLRLARMALQNQARLPPFALLAILDAFMLQTM
jgi:hypothetical protein